MFLTKLSLTHFKNYTEATVDFDEQVVCITGPNGAGKTNLLDAIYYLCLTKSYFNPADTQNINHQSAFFTLTGIFQKDRPCTVFCRVSHNDPKVFKKNRVRYARLSEHVGLLPVVMIAPSDLQLITEGSELRRRFVDSIIAQYDPQYLHDLVRYKKLIDQRNKALKQFAENRRFDATYIETLDDQLNPPGTYLHQQRAAFSGQYLPLFQEVYGKIAGREEVVSMQYRSDLHDLNLSRLLRQNIEQDRMLQRTTAGVHKDDFVFRIGDHEIKKFGSQGQQKSFIFGLKLAQYLLLKKHKEDAPILLLDDLFDRLDHQRVARLLEIVLGDAFGQVFLTDTQSGRLNDILKARRAKFQMFQVQEGTITEDPT